jgi:prepilin-type processing-associated H-X9-DG protein
MCYLLPYIEQDNLWKNLSNDTANFYITPISNAGGSNPFGYNPTNPNDNNIDTFGTRHNVNTTAGDVSGSPAAQTIINTYICPADVLPQKANNGYAKSNYVANIGNTANWTATFGCGAVRGDSQNGPFRFSNNNNLTWITNMASILDGTSNTVAVGEATMSVNVTPSAINDGAFPIWAGGNPNGRGCGDIYGLGSTFRIMDTAYPLNRRTGNESMLSFGSMHSGGANFLFLDGTVRFISDGIDTNTYRWLGSADGGEVVSLP